MSRRDTPARCRRSGHRLACSGVDRPPSGTFGGDRAADLAVSGLNRRCWGLTEGVRPVACDAKAYRLAAPAAGVDLTLPAIRAAARAAARQRLVQRGWRAAAARLAVNGSMTFRLSSERRRVRNEVRALTPSVETKEVHMLMRSEPFTEVNRLAQQLFGTPVTGTWTRPAAM